MFDPQGLKYIAGLVGTDYRGPNGLLGSALFTRPVNSGEIVTLYGTGFGPTTPAAVRPSILGAEPHRIRWRSASEGGNTSVKFVRYRAIRAECGDSGPG
jgi:uncharacterized protein (TIGR03437 family)